MTMKTAANRSNTTVKTSTLAPMKVGANGPSKRSAQLVKACEDADAAYCKAFETYANLSFKAAASACLSASLMANREGCSDWADYYGRKHAEMNRKACGG